MKVSDIFSVTSKRAGRKGLSCLALALSMLLATPAVAHTPYGQWNVFRQGHLQVLTARSDLTGDTLADKWVAILAEHLPESHAMVSRARNFTRVASLLKTDQAKLAVLSHDQANAMFNGLSPFEDFKPMPLQILIDDGNYMLVARDDLPLEHAYVVVATLLEQAEALKLSVPATEMFGISVHPGARFAEMGEPIDLEAPNPQ